MVTTIKGIRLGRSDGASDFDFITVCHQLDCKAKTVLFELLDQASHVLKPGFTVSDPPSYSQTRLHSLKPDFTVSNPISLSQTNLATYTARAKEFQATRQCCADAGGLEMVLMISSSNGTISLYSDSFCPPETVHILSICATPGLVRRSLHSPRIKTLGFPLGG